MSEPAPVYTVHAAARIEPATDDEYIRQAVVNLRSVLTARRIWILSNRIVDLANAGFGALKMCWHNYKPTLLIDEHSTTWDGRRME